MDPWIPWATFSTDLASATAVLQRYADKQAEDTARIYGIWLDGTLVGGVMFTRFDSTSGVCEVGCWLEAAGEGRGLVTRACRALIDWAFTERGMTRVEWWAAAGNTRSIEVARRLGMTRDGVLRQHSLYRGCGATARSGRSFPRSGHSLERLRLREKRLRQRCQRPTSRPSSTG